MGMRKACLLHYVRFNRREERIAVALRAGRIVTGRNEELVSVLIIAVRIMTGGAGQQPERVPVVVGPDEVRVLLVVRLRIERSRKEARRLAIDALGVVQRKLGSPGAWQRHQVMVGKRRVGTSCADAPQAGVTPVADHQLASRSQQTRGNHLAALRPVFQVVGPGSMACFTTRVDLINTPQ